MKFHDRHAWAAYESPYLAITFRRRDARLAFLGIDSGGRRWDHKNTYNLLKPSQGALSPAIDRAATKPPEFLPPRPPEWKKPEGAPPVPSEWLGQSACDAGLAASASGVDFAFSPVDDRTFDISVESKDGAPLKGPFWEMSLQIKTAPPTIWAETRMDDPVQVEARNHAHPRHPECNELARRVWRLPMVVHFPDFGHVRIEAAEGEADCLERLLKSEEFSGLNLGFLNLGSHTQNCGLHYGRSLLAFRPKKGCKRAVLRFTVLPEIAPHPATGEDFTKDAKWDGFRRNYLNGFTVNRPTMTMGDHVNLAGYAHLAVQNKADLLDLSADLPDPTLALVRKVFVHQTDAAMRAQDADGEINWDYPHEPKKPGERSGLWVDTTPANMIAACTCLRWEPRHAKKWYPALVRAADYLLGMDVDGDAILENPFSGISFGAPYEHPGHRPVNWWDNIAYGHKDAWYNLLSHRALRLVGDLAARRGDKATAARIRDWMARFGAAFRPALVNPETGVVAGWRDRDGKLHDWLFTCPTSMALNEAVLTPEEGRPMLRTLLDAMAAEGFGDLKYGIPGNCRPIPLSTDTFDWAFMGAWPRYENGGLCGMTAWHFLNAMYRCGMREEADGIYFRMLDTFENWPTHSGLFPGYMESVDWRTKEGNPCGYNYLADNYLFLGSGYLAHSGREHTAIAP